MLREMTPKLLRLSDLGCLLGLSAHRMEGFVHSGRVKASRLSVRCQGRRPGHWYVTTTEACRVLREFMLTGKDLAAGDRAVFRAAKRLDDSVHAVGLHDCGSPVAAVKPGTE